ncbi:MAG TPA: DUF4013 domain-containing protein [Oceanipulchritudo sp.]|nr:DUF4013 domain-containing protein [Oceanipulchritudo sp.]
MENMEKISWRIWSSEGFGKALLIGGLLFYIPVINLLMLGYYGVWVQKLVQKKGMDLPEWRDGRAILNELLRIIGPYLLWVVVPFALAGLLVWAVSGMLSFLGLGFFTKTVAWLPVAVVAILSPLAFTVSLVRLYRANNLKAALAVPEVLQGMLQHLKASLFPILQYYGILVLGWPLFGFAAFLGTLPLLAQLILIINRHDEDLKNEAY